MYMSTKLTKTKHTKRMGISGFVVVRANVARMRRLMQLGAIYHALYDQFLRNNISTDSEGGYRDITPVFLPAHPGEDSTQPSHAHS